MRNYPLIAKTYISDVLSGKIVTGKWVTKACQRQQDDLHRDFAFRFDEKKASLVCMFIENLVHIKGPKSGQKIVLEPWQVFILTTVFGWLNKESGKRRFRRVYIEVARGNGKSALSSGVALYMLAADGEGGAEVYSAARTKDQAKIVFEVAKAMLRNEQTAKLREHFGLASLANSVVTPAKNGIFKALASEADSLDGLNTHFGCLDELHAHPTRDVHDVLDTSTGKRDNSMLWSITTAGTNRSGICFEIRDYVTKILDNVFHDESYFGIVYALDEKDSFKDRKVWIKANPNLNVSVFLDDLEQKCKKAEQQASSQPAFKTKHCNIWCQTDSAWMDMSRFLHCADADLKPEQFVNDSCVIGVDLASKLDLAASIKIFAKVIDKKMHYFAFGDYWTPQARIENSPNASYKGWATDGWLHTCDGDTNDFDLIGDHIRADCKALKVIRVAVDPYQAVEIGGRLTKEGVKVVEVPQMPKYLGPAMKELEAAIYDGRFHYTGDPILAWAVSNVVCHLDKNDNPYPNKARAENKIDPLTALLTGIHQVMALNATGELNSVRRRELLVFA